MLQTFFWLGGYNNYSDRIIKRTPSSQSDIWDFLDDWPQVVYRPNTNFDVGDGVNTSVVVEWTDRWTPNYVWVVGNIDGGANRVQGWFVMEFHQIRGQQYQAVLHRDVVADNYEDVINAPCFIEKATLKNNDPMIFNSEGMTYNQIKTEEKLLKDSTDSAWIVGYFDNNFHPESEDTSASEDVAVLKGSYYAHPNYTYSHISDWPYYSYAGRTINTVHSQDVVYNISYVQSVYQPSSRVYLTNTISTIKVDRYRHTGTFNPSRDFSYITYSGSGVSGDPTPIIPPEITPGYMMNMTPPAAVQNTLWTKGKLLYEAFGTIPESYYTYERQLINATSEAVVENIWKYKGAVLKDNSTGKLYKVNIERTSEDVENIKVDTTSPLYEIIRTRLNNTNLLLGDMNNNVLTLTITKHIYTITLVNTLNETSTLKINWPNTYKTLNDNPYSMFCIPYNLDGYHIGEIGSTMNPETALAVARTLSEKMQPQSSGGHLIDLQLLPYCPIEELRLGLNAPNYAAVLDENQPGEDPYIGVIYFSTNSNFDLFIEHDISIEDNKISHECDLYRLSSPNFANYDDFSPSMNNGISGFHVECTYKPYNPYINIHIDYKGLYGKDFDDARGLICGGDFSMPVMSDQWAQYQIDNKNYAAIFDRGIQHQEINNKWEMANTITNAISGTVQGAASGAMTGAMAGGPTGAIVGAAVGGTAAAVGGALDIAQTAQLQKENINYQKDLYNYNLGNIQARPQGLAKTSGFVINNKLWPFLEYYTCTDTEKQALKDKLRYNGMTVMRIGKIADFIGDSEEDSYIQGKLIRLNTISEDNHMIMTIIDEIAKGVYL